MATSKKITKKPTGFYHPSRTRASSYSDNFFKKFILVIIFSTMLVVIIAVICCFTLNSERRVQNDITKLATEYYEDYFYENLTHSTRFQSTKAFNEVMDKYHTYGLSPIRLSDLLLYDNQKNAKYRDFLTKYCDENLTIIKFYPDSPYGKQDYRTDITYSCNF